MKDVEVRLASGTLRGEEWGDPASPLLILLPGYSQDERSFEAIAPRFADRYHVVAIALRGRGRSDTVGPWGAPAHAEDVAELATALGADRFSVIGWSFGALVAMTLAASAGDRIDQLVLIDLAGQPDELSMAVIRGNQNRLSMVHPSIDGYVDTVLASGLFDGAEDFFRDYLRGDLVPVDGGYRVRTSPEIVHDEVLGSDETTGAFHDLWPSLTMPVLLLRAARPINGGFIVPETERDAFVAAVPTARALDVDANHGTIGVVPESADAIDAFLR